MSRITRTLVTCRAITCSGRHRRRGVLAGEDPPQHPKILIGDKPGVVLDPRLKHLELVVVFGHEVPRPARLLAYSTVNGWLA